MIAEMLILLITFVELTKYFFSRKYHFLKKKVYYFMYWFFFCMSQLN